MRRRAQLDNVSVARTGEWPTCIPHGRMRITATSEHARNHHGYVYAAANTIDDRPETIWHSEFEPRASLPQSVTLDLGSAVEICGLACQPRLDTPKGMITRYNVYLSDDGWAFDKVASGTWPATTSTKLASWPPRKAQYVRLEAVAGEGKLASIGELDIATTSRGGLSQSSPTTAPR
ncbi:MAG: discoidin domain-containing protein [Phycisphaerae bacterium]|nr:discoidin domain-containing protein [Phycisphaerae bacterium]